MVAAIAAVVLAVVPAATVIAATGMNIVATVPAVVPSATVIAVPVIPADIEM